MSRTHPSRSFAAAAALAACVPWVPVSRNAQDDAPPAKSPPPQEQSHQHAKPDDDPAVSVPATDSSLRATLGHEFYARGTPEKLVLMIEVNAPAANAAAFAEIRPPLNLALVIDRSGSMADKGKFEYAAQAVALAVENLSERDVVSVIAFNQDAVVLSPAGRAVNKGFLRHRLSEIEPDGWTNLSAGLLEAFSQIDSASAEGQTKRIILVTDGLANRGVTDAGRLREMVDAVRTRGIAVSTMGVGTTFDQKLLESLAEHGGGRYAYIREGDELPTVMQKELSGFLSVTAQNAHLEIVPTGGARIARVFGRLPEVLTDRFAIDLGDLRDGEHGRFVMELMPGTFNDGASAGAEAALTMDLPGQAVRVRQAASVFAAFTTDSEKARLSERETVTVAAATLDALDKAAQAAAGLDQGLLRDVSAAFQRLHERARRVAIESRDQDLLNDAFMLKHVMDELSAAAQAGLIHEHDEARRRLVKDIDFQRYLLQHHTRRQ